MNNLFLYFPYWKIWKVDEMSKTGKYKFCFLRIHFLTKSLCSIWLLFRKLFNYCATKRVLVNFNLNLFLKEEKSYCNIKRSSKILWNFVKFWTIYVCLFLSLITKQRGKNKSSQHFILYSLFLIIISIKLKDLNEMKRFKTGTI